MKRVGDRLRPWQWVVIASVPAWMARLAFFRRNVYMGFDQARDSFIFEQLSKGIAPAYGPYALSGGYYMPNYYYRFYGALNIIDKADPVFQTLPFVVLSGIGVTLVMLITWYLIAVSEPALRLRYRLLITCVPLLLLGFSYNELINNPLMWNPVNLVFWQAVLFLLYMRIQRREPKWRRPELYITWFCFGLLAVLAASMHGTFLYAVPCWCLGLLGWSLFRRQWRPMVAFAAGAAFMLWPFIHTESKHGFENIKVMAGLGGGSNGQIQNGIDTHVASNLWNNMSQLAHKVWFGLDKPAAFWTIIMILLCMAGLVLMAVVYKKMRWYVWWVSIYLVMAALFRGERGDTIISWHYQQNIMVLPVFSCVVLILFAVRLGVKSRKKLDWRRVVVQAAIGLLLAIFLFGVIGGFWRMMSRQYAAVYAKNHSLMTTYQMEQVISLLPEGSVVCVPFGYYHPATFEYLSKVRLQRTGDTFLDSCTSDTEYYWILKQYYTFWPPHYAVDTLEHDVQRYDGVARKLYETNQYVLLQRINY